jgi:hypothetical protein
MPDAPFHDPTPIALPTLVRGAIACAMGHAVGGGSFRMRKTA